MYACVYIYVHICIYIILSPGELVEDANHNDTVSPLTMKIM